MISELFEELENMVDVNKQRKKFLNNLACFVEADCPNLATYYRLKLNETKQRIPDFNKTPLRGTCPYCNKPFETGSYRTRLAPKPKLTDKLRKLLNRYSANPGHLGKFQRKLVDNYIEGNNKLVTTCLTCRKRVKQNGQSRIERRRQKDKHDRENMVMAITDIVEEKPALTDKERQKERKKEKKKMLKKRRKAGLTDTDVNAGLKLPDISQPTSSPVKPRSVKQTDDLTKGVGYVEPVGSVKEASTSLNPVSTATTSSSVSFRSQTGLPEKLLQTGLPEKLLHSDSPDKLSSKSRDVKVKTKSSAIDLDRILSKKTEEKSKMGLNTVISGNALTKSQKKKQLGQKLGLLLKQEKKGPRGGTLSDFLSSL